MTTPNLGLTLPTIGADVDTWGDELNANLVLIDTAFGMVLTVAGGTLTGPLFTVASGTGGAGFRLPHGAAPTSPVNGDLWTTTAGLFVRINGVTQTSMLGANNLSDLANAASARTNLGLGSLATAGSINNANWSGTALSIVNGGTGATTQGAAQTALGIGSAGLASTGTSGATVPLLNGTNTWSAVQAFPTGTTYATRRIASVASGSATNTGRISWGTSAPGTLDEGEIYLKTA